LAIWLGVVVPFAVGSVVLWLIAPGGQEESATSSATWLIPELARPHLSGLRERLVMLWVLLGAGTMLTFVGLIDDRHDLDWQVRLGIQFVIAGICVVWQGWQLTAFMHLPWLTAALSAVWIVALINSFNMLDNMDGLSGGVAVIAAGMLVAVLLLTPAETNGPQLFVAGLLLVIIGAVLGFLLHNRPPARLFMGDAGSYFVGFCIAVSTLLATYAGYHSPVRHTILAPVCVMAVPLYDMVTVLWIRMREGRSPFQADKSHFSHRLVELGLSKGQAVLTIYLTTATCGLGALLLGQVDRIGAAVIVLMIVCVLSLIAILETSARRKLKRRTTTSGNE
jgi:UDP-GlcNAc:undecaprenyl-phosphate GlcNAc-1-phosphate transferase